MMPSCRYTSEIFVTEFAVAKGHLVVEEVEAFKIPGGRTHWCMTSARAETSQGFKI